MTSASPVNAPVENALLLVIVQLVVIMGAARLFGRLFRRLGQPQVCGEIAAGLILGPSLFGRLFPQLFARLFDPSVNSSFSLVSQVGLILLMFLIGLEFDFGHLEDNRRTALSVSVVGIILPFALGLAVGKLMYSSLGGGDHWLNFSLFMATAMSITAIPTLGRIMIELNIQRTRIGSLAISAAAVDDASGWIILALVTAIVRSTFDPVRLSLMIGATVGYGLVMFFVVRPLVRRWVRTTMRTSRGELSLDSLAVLLVLVFLSAAATNLIGIFSIFGGFAFGAILYDQHDLRAAVRRRLSDFVSVFFLPIFFTYTGLRTDVGSMNGVQTWVFCGLVLLAAVAGKFGGCTAAAFAHGLPLREASMIGIMMNTRALMELIVINIGFDLGILPKSVFFILVFMAVVTTYTTTPILRRLIRGSEVEAEYLKSEFAMQQRA